MKAAILTTGSGGKSKQESEYKHYIKMKGEYESGKLKPVFHPLFLEMHEDYRFVNYTPPYILKNAWATYWDVRNTKLAKTPVTHQDVLAYITLMRRELLPTEVDLIFIWDDCYYKYYSQYNQSQP